MLKEFKKFILRGNVLDLAVGVIIGGAFTKIVTSLVNDLIMPLLGMFTGGLDFSGLFVILGKVPDGETVTTLDQAKALNVATLNYGSFITQVIDFILMALVIFLFIRFINKLSDLGKKKLGKEEAEKEPTTKVCPYCKTEIDIAATRCPHCTSQLGAQE